MISNEKLCKNNTVILDIFCFLCRVGFFFFLNVEMSNYEVWFSVLNAVDSLCLAQFIENSCIINMGFSCTWKNEFYTLPTESSLSSMYNMFIKYLSLFIQVLTSLLFIQAETNTKCGTSAVARKSI